MAGQSNNFDGTSVSGGFNVQGNQFNGPVNIGGSNRDDTDDLQCLRLLKTVNPEDERRRILTVKDQLVTASYSWILEDEAFKSWRDEDTNHLLWIKGGPGKGKTMMMAGLVDLLSEARNSEGAIALSYFFCQNSETELRKVTSILKGLIYMLAFRERRLVHHLRRKYEAGGEEIFTGRTALFALWHVLKDMLRDFHGVRVYLIVDGLDECNDPEFDDFLLLLSDCNGTTPGKVKWLVTSRPLPRIEEIIGPDQNRYRISLEIEAQHVSQGVETFINEKVNLLRLKKSWSNETTQTVHSYLQKNAQGTFLWVALVCQRLRRFPPWKVKDELTKLASLQRGLDSFYERMMQVVRDEIPEYADLCMNILRTTTLAYRPLRLQELGTVVALPHELQSDDSPNFDALRDLIDRCGSFILVHEDTIYFVHQSAKDYLSGEPGSKSFPLNRLQEHASIAERCLDTLNLRLKDRQFPDPTSLNKKEPGEDQLRLLSRIAYACSYWIHHTLESVAQNSYKGSIPNQKKICDLFDSHLIAWVHALGSLKELTACVRMIKEFLDIQGFESTDFFHMVQDTYRFLRLNKQIIEESPSQVYTSALLFVPKSSWIRKVYQNRIPKWIRLRTQLNNIWDACLVTLLGHSDMVGSVIFSSDGSLLASRSGNCTRLWETETGNCRVMLSHDSDVSNLAFSPDDRVLLTGSGYNIELLDTITGSQQSLLVGHRHYIRRCLFAPNSQILASADDVSVRLWNIVTGSSCGMFEIGINYPWAMDFSCDSKRIVIGAENEVQVRDVETSNVATFREHCGYVLSVQFSPDSRLVLSVSYRSQIWLWSHATTKPGVELEGPFGDVTSAKFSPDGNLIVSTHDGETSAILWETSTGNKLHVFPVPSSRLSRFSEPMFSPDSRTIVTPRTYGGRSWNTTTGEEVATFEGVEETNGGSVMSSICSKDGKFFAQTMGYKIGIWEVATGALLLTLEGHSDSVLDLAFSPVGGLIASASSDKTVKLWSLSKSPSNQATIREKIAEISLVIVSLDGTLAASTSDDKGIRLWGLESGASRTLQKLKPKNYPDMLLISPDNSLVAAKNYLNLCVWETQTGSLRYECTTRDNNGFWRIAFSPDSRLLKIELRDDTTKLVEIHAQGFEDVRKPSHAGSTESQNSPDGRFFVDLDQSFSTSCLWERQKDTEQAILKFKLGHTCGTATFSPDSRLIVFVSNQRFISVWETETGVCLTLFCTGPVSFSHDSRLIPYTLGSEDNLRLLPLSNGLSQELALVSANAVNFVKFSPDASIVAATSGSAILLCETKSGSVARKLEHDQKRVSDIAFLPDRDALIAGHEDGTIRSWDTKNNTLLHTLSTKDCPPLFSLDSKRKFLWTGDQGFFFHEFLQPCKMSAISLEDNWVLFNRERVFWLPTEFRASSYSGWAASGKSLVVGGPSGELTIVDFEI